MYQDDEAARAARAHALIAEIADLERRSLEHQAIAGRLREAGRELDVLRTAPPARRRPGTAAHVAVFTAAALVAGAATLLLLAG